MSTINRWIIVLLMVGLCGLIYMEAFVKPGIAKREERYQLEQLDPSTHDLNYVLPYKNKYMGNASNLSNLNRHLPLADLRSTFQLYPDRLTAEIHFDKAAAHVNETLLRRTLIYNATANFALIDNLQGLVFRFTDLSYTFTREEVQSWYGERFEHLLDREVWNREVKGRLDQLAADVPQHASSR